MVKNQLIAYNGRNRYIGTGDQGNAAVTLPEDNRTGTHLDQPLVETAGDSMKIVELVEATGTNYSISGFDLLDHIEENTTFEDIINLIEDEDLRNTIPM